MKLEMNADFFKQYGDRPRTLFVDGIFNGTLVKDWIRVELVETNEDDITKV